MAKRESVLSLTFFPFRLPNILRASLKRLRLRVVLLRVELCPSYRLRKDKISFVSPSAQDNSIFTATANQPLWSILGHLSSQCFRN